MTDHRLTRAQVKALMALPEDGSWLSHAGRMTPALDSLRLMHRWFFSEAEWSREEKCYRHRLTKAGIAERKKREGAS